jgi:hypothetical protein
MLLRRERGDQAREPGEGDAYTSDRHEEELPRHPPGLYALTSSRRRRAEAVNRRGHPVAASVRLHRACIGLSSSFFVAAEGFEPPTFAL